MDTKVIAGAAVVLLLVLVGAYMMMPASPDDIVVMPNGVVAVLGDGISDVAPTHSWKKIYANTNWASGSDKALNMDGLTLNQCMNHTLDNGRPGFVYNAGMKKCLLKNSFGQGSKLPNSVGWVAYVT